jgi:hypothetical protein
MKFCFSSIKRPERRLKFQRLIRWVLGCQLQLVSEWFIHETVLGAKSGKSVLRHEVRVILNPVTVTQIP